METLRTEARATLNPALRGFWEARGYRNRILYGGRASSKSWDAAGMAVYLASNYKLRVLCVRQFQNRIEESVYALLKIQIDRFGLSDAFDVQKNKIFSETGSEFMFYGLWRSIDEIKSLEGIDILWIEEGHGLTEVQWKILEATVRKANAQVWIVFNPRLATDFVWKRFVLKPPKRTLIRKINYPENPFLSKDMRGIIAEAKEEDLESYLHVYEGEPKADDEGVVIKRAWVTAAIDAHKTLGMKGLGRKRMGFDIADSGQDKCANVFAEGSIVRWADQWSASEDELLKSCTRTYHAARERSAAITYDSIGVGASAGAKFAELNSALNPVFRIQFDKFNAGSGVFRPEAQYEVGIKNKDQFSNIKAQAWWMVADRFRNTYNAVRNGAVFDESELVSLDSSTPHLELLIDELTTPLRDYDGNGRVKVESKKDLAKRDVASPNLADAFVMAFAPTQAPMQISAAALASA